MHKVEYVVSRGCLPLSPRASAGSSQGGCQASKPVTQWRARGGNSLFTFVPMATWLMTRSRSLSLTHASIHTHTHCVCLYVSSKQTPKENEINWNFYPKPSKEREREGWKKVEKGDDFNGFFDFKTIHPHNVYVYMWIEKLIEFSIRKLKYKFSFFF